MMQRLQEQRSQLWFERWDQQFCISIKQWHAIETGNGGLPVIDVDALCDEADLLIGDTLAPEALQQARLEVYDQFRALYAEMEEADPETPYRDIMLRRLSSFCSDIEDLVLRPEERSRQERYERRLHIPFARLSDACFQIQAETLLEALQMWMCETGITLDMPPEDGSALEKISRFSFKDFFRNHFEHIEVGQDPSNPEKLCEADIKRLRDCIDHTANSVKAYWKSRPALWSGPDFTIGANLKYTLSQTMPENGKEAFGSWLYGRGDKFVYSVNLDLPAADNDFKKISIIKARLIQDVTHEMYHCRHFSNLWHQLKSGSRKDGALPRCLGLTTVRSSELVPGEFCGDGFAGLFAHERYFGVAGKPGNNSLHSLELLIFARYKWFLLMKNNRLIHTGRTYGLAAANREKEEIFFHSNVDREVGQTILPRALDWRSTSFDPYYTPVYGQLTSWCVSIIHNLGKEAFERMVSDLSRRSMDAPELLTFIKNKGCDLMVSPTSHFPPMDWKSFADKMRYPLA